jgi:hypothetical protein
MNTLETQVEKIGLLLSKVGGYLDNLTFETFDEVFPKTLSTIKQVHEIKFELLKKYGSECLSLFEKKLFLNAKQIEDQFDNIVKIFIAQEKKLEKELLTSIQKKKLIYYQKV